MELARKRDGSALGFAMLFPLVMAWLYFVVLADESSEADPLFQFAFSAGKLVQFLFPAVYVWWFDREELTPAWPSSRGMALAVGFAALVSAGMFAIYYGWLKHSPLFGETPMHILAKVQQFGLATRRGYLMLGLFICIAHSLFEEYYWRWFVFGWLKRHLPVPAAVALSAVGFTLHHIVILGVYFPQSFWLLAVPFALCVGVGGGVWAWIYHRAGSLYAPWISHALIDTAILLIGFDMLAAHLQAT
jgi:membrane protease YdiL (CAAX protease family)